MEKQPHLEYFSVAATDFDLKDTQKYSHLLGSLQSGPLAAKQPKVSP